MSTHNTILRQVFNLVLVATVLHFMLLQLHSTHYEKVGNLETLFHDELHIQSPSQTKLCRHANDLVSNSSALEEAIAKAKAFHIDGGNLKALQDYLDRQIQHSYEDYDLKFIPNTVNKNSPKVTHNVVTHLKEHYIKNHPLYAVRGGYGQNLPGHFEGAKENKFLVEGRWISVREPVTRERWEVSMGPIGPECNHLTSFGTRHETKYLCDMPVDQECHILSIGCNDEWGFEIDVQNKMSHCHTHTFDCTLKGPPKRKPNNPKIHFYPYCISAQNEEKDGRKYLTYEEMWKETGVTQAPKVLKMDIEGFEYDVWTGSILKSPSEMWPEQVIMELHYSTRMVDLPWMLRQLQAGELALFVELLFRKGGYLPAHQFWPTAPSLVEVLMIRVLCNE